MTSIDTLLYEEPYILPDDTLKRYEIRRIPVLKIYKEDLLRIYPNPANSYVVVEYTLKSKEIEAWLELTNSIGILMNTIKLNEQRDYLIMSLNSLKTGIYFIKFISNNSLIETKKLIITK